MPHFICQFKDLKKIRTHCVLNEDCFTEVLLLCLTSFSLYPLLTSLNNCVQNYFYQFRFILSMPIYYLLLISLHFYCRLSFYVKHFVTCIERPYINSYRH